MKKLFLILLSLITLAATAQSRINPVGMSNARNSMKGIWQFSGTQSAYTVGDSLRVVYYKQLRAIETALDTAAIKTFTSTGATVTNVDTLSGLINQIVYWEVEILSNKVPLPGVEYYRKTFVVTNSAGTYSASTIDATGQSNVTNGNFTVTISGGLPILQATGNAGETIKWTFRITPKIFHTL
jgi:hypothetical protein